MSTRVRDVASLVVAVLIPLIVGGLGSLATGPAIPTWYRTIQKPAWTPPNWLFGPVWTLLFILMGVALYLVWRRGWEPPGVRLAVALFAVQLVFNLLWSVLFFGLHSPGWALVEIVVLWVLILATLVSFRRLSPVAGWLLVPYLLWVTFATALNAGVWWLNRT